MLLITDVLNADRYKNAKHSDTSCCHIMEEDLKQN